MEFSWSGHTAWRTLFHCRLGPDFTLSFEKQNHMNLKSLLLPVVLFGVLACKQNKQVTSAQKVKTETVSSEPAVASPPVAITPAEDPAVDTPKTELKTPDSLMAFIVSFYSGGAGIDRGMPDKLKSFIESFSKKIEIEIPYNESHWGREGETDYCFPLTGLSDAQVTGFITGAKDALKSSQQVHFFEKQPCRKHR
jgi:hypothetical protein